MSLSLISKINSESLSATILNALFVLVAGKSDKSKLKLYITLVATTTSGSWPNNLRCSASDINVPSGM